MPPARLSADVLRHAAQLVAASNGNVTHAAIKAGMSRGTLQHQYRMAVAAGIKPDVVVVDAPKTPRPTDFDAAWNVLAAEIGMREDRYEGPCQRPRSDKVAVVSDIHAPFHESALLAQAFADTSDADTLIIAGDIGDGFGWSRFTKYQTVPYEREIAAVAAIVQTASQRYRRVLISDGNHDGPRLEKQLRERLSPEMVEAILFMTGGTLSPIHALARRFENVEIVGHVTPDGQRMGWLYQHGDVLCAHAEKYSVVPVSALRKIEEWLTDMDQHLGLKPWRVLIQAHCFTDDTEVLTKNGWKTFDQVNVFTEVLTRSPWTGISEWNQVEEVVHYDDFTEMVSFENTVCNLVVTPDHAVFGRSRSSRSDKFERHRASEWEGREIEMPVGGINANEDYPISDDLLRLMAWVIAEGTYVKDCNGIRIAQSDKPKVGPKRITDLCEKLGVPYTIQKKHSAGQVVSNRVKNFDHYSIRVLAGEWAARIRELAPDKKLQPWILRLSHRQFLAFFEEMMLADGSHGGTRGYQYATKWEEEADLMQAACAYNGFRTSKLKRQRQYTYYALVINTRDTVTTIGSRVPYSGRVWCARVENGTLVVRRNGKVVVSGNTHQGGVTPWKADKLLVESGCLAQTASVPTDGSHRREPAASRLRAL